jgi:hypothetical protein
MPQPATTDAFLSASGVSTAGTQRFDGRCSRRSVLSRAPSATYRIGMCRNIHTLHNFEPAATNDEVHAAALQYVRKISGSTKPSKANQEAFDRAVAEIAHITGHLLEDLVTSAPPKNRDQRSAKRFAA